MKFRDHRTDRHRARLRAVEQARLDADARLELDTQPTEEPWVPPVRRRPRRLLQERTVLALLPTDRNTNGDEEGAAQPLHLLRLGRAA